MAEGCGPAWAPVMQWHNVSAHRQLRSFGPYWSLPECCSVSYDLQMVQVTQRGLRHWPSMRWTRWKCMRCLGIRHDSEGCSVAMQQLTDFQRIILLQQAKAVKTRCLGVWFWDMAEWSIISAVLGKVHLPVTIDEQFSVVMSAQSVCPAGWLYPYCLCVQCCVFVFVLLVSMALWCASSSVGVSKHCNLFCSKTLAGTLWCRQGGGCMKACVSFGMCCWKC